MFVLTGGTFLDQKDSVGTLQMAIMADFRKSDVVAKWP